MSAGGVETTQFSPASSDQLASEARGCYGLRIAGLDGASRHLSPVDTSLPLLRVQRLDVSTIESFDSLLDANRAVLPLSGEAGRSDVDRASLTARLSLVHDHADEVILHPFLAGTAAVANWWVGRDVFHAGAFQLGCDSSARAWAVLGDKGMGKSTTLGYLGLQGVPIVSDDMLVVDEGSVHAGPAFIDLRGDAAQGLGVGRDLGIVGARHRARLDVTHSAPIVPLAGWIRLAWGDEPELVPVPAVQRLPTLLDNRAVWRPPPDQTSFLRHLALPMLELRRPRDWRALPHVRDLLTVLG